MRHVFAALLLLVTPAPAFAAAAGVSFRSGTIAEALKVAKAQKKKLFVDVYATWCGPCHRMDAQVYAKPNVAKALEKQWIALKVDGEAGEGPEVLKRYHVVGYPTALFLDEAGEEIDRVFGEMPADEFVATAQAFAKGEKTLARAEDAYFDGHLFDANMAGDLAERFAVKGDEARAEFYRAEVKRIAADFAAVASAPRGQGALDAAPFDRRSETAKKSAQHAVEVLRRADLSVAKFAYLRGSKNFKAAKELLEGIVDRHAGTPEAREAQLLLATADHGLNDDIAAKKALDAYVAGASDAHAYNAYAWWCFKQQAFLEDGISAAKKGLELDPKDDGLWDTLAELQFATGRADEAVASEQKALSLGPGDAAYYKSQIQKFSKQK